MSETYKLSATLYGHSADVRSLAASADGNFVSGSRDLSAKLWQQESATSANFINTASFTCHSNFVSSVCILPPSLTHPQGIIVTGSNDKKVRLFEPNASSPFKTLADHTNTVCKVSPSSFGWTFLSASWDLTARGWREEGENWVSAKFSGHSMAVWSVCQLSCGLVVTASADKTLKVYGEGGDLLRTLTGHSDCVRDVAAFSNEIVVSVANDASVRSWNAVAGECLNTYYGHGHYIYSVAIVPNIGWVTSSEDRTIKVWSLNDEVDSIMLPCASVWSVAVLPNHDIVAGSNDGVIRIFTKSAERTADTQALAAFKEEVKKLSDNTPQEVGGVKINELPGREALLVPGRRDGQTKMVREGNKAVAYAWSAQEATWQQIGDVVGSQENAAGQTGRPTYEGQEYDFVFNVDVEDGKPALKLPYNRDEDPWMAAQKFIHKNFLPQSYLEQVANFIITNAGQAQTTAPQPEFVDPFTGGSRYVPQSSSSSTNFGVVGRPSAPAASKPIDARYFPQREFLRFDQANVSAMKDKILLLNRDNLGVDESKIDILLNKCDSLSECSQEDIAVLDTLLKWPTDVVFPVLDVLRLLIKKDNVAAHFCNNEFLKYLQSHLQIHPNNMLALRICCNMMRTLVGEEFAAKHRLTLIEYLLSVPSPYSKFLQTALATLLLNLSVLIRKSPTPDGRNEALLAGRELLPSLTEEEAIFRCMVALGTMLNDLADRVHFIEPLRSILVKHSASSADRLRDCANDILALVQL